MKRVEIEELGIENVRVLKSSGFNGFEIEFSVCGQTFVFIIGNSGNLYPLSVKHQFSKQENCSLCGKIIYPAPIGHQLCMYFQNNRQQLLEYFSRYIPTEE